MPVNSNNIRIEWIDTAKGLGIILVVLGHIVFGGGYNTYGSEMIGSFIYSFHMPLFFVISGLLIKETRRFDGKYVRKVFKSYIIPYIVWTVIYTVGFLATYILKGTPIREYFSMNNRAFVHSITVCGLAPLWFLLALFFSEVIVVAIKQLLDRKILAVIILGAFVVATILAVNIYNGINHSNMFVDNILMGAFRVFPTTFFVMFGYVVKKWIMKLNEIRLVNRILIIIALTIVQVILCAVWKSGIDVHIFVMPNAIIYFIKSLNGVALFILISQLIKARSIRYLGKKTKELMILHYPPFYWTAGISYFLNRLFAPNLFGVLVIAVVTIMACLAIDRLLSNFRWWNFIMGK